MTREELLHVQAGARAYQQRADEAFQSWGVRAPQMALGQTLADYRRDLDVKAKKLLPNGDEYKLFSTAALPITCSITSSRNCSDE